jgi:hypothetical protein
VKQLAAALIAAQADMPADVEPAALSRFHAKYAVDVTTFCWEWTAALDPNGYSVHKNYGRKISGHRFAFLAFVGPIPADRQIDHVCRNKRCVNPAHLDCVTAQENTLRADGPSSRNAARTRCIHGHAFSLLNTYITPDGRRMCRECQRARTRTWRQPNR